MLGFTIQGMCEIVIKITRYFGYSGNIVKYTAGLIGYGSALCNLIGPYKVDANRFITTS